MLKSEFHVHTRYSKDSMLGKYLILLVCKIKRINCIAITDHNEIKGALKYSKLLQKYNIQVIIGEEIFTSDGEIIGLFLKDKILPKLSVKETIKQIKSQGGLVYVPHPYDEKRKKTVLKEECIKEFSKEIDVIEVHNGRNIEENYDDVQRKIAKENNILPIIGSDAHIVWELGRNIVVCKEEISKENFIEVIKNSKFIVKKCIKFSHTYTKYIKALKMIFRGEINELYRIINKKCRRKEYRDCK